MNIKWNKLFELVKSSKKILLSTHINPDGDGLGSEVAMYNYLHKLGKECKIVNISDIGEKYRFLNKNDIIEKYDRNIHKNWIESCDCALIFDIGNYKRLGEIAEILQNNNIYKVSIDHHPSNDNFFDHRFLDIQAPATGYLVWKFFKSIEFKFNKDSAEALYTALITDTGSFRYNSTTPDCHTMAKEILEIGVKPYNVYASVYEQRTIPQVKLLSAVIESMYMKSEFLSIRISQKMLKQCDADLEDVDGFTDFARSIKGVEVSFMISEINQNKFRINFRSRGKYIINDIAQYFNGGGHKLAAGATVENTTIDKLENKIFKMLQNKKELLCQ